MTMVSANRHIPEPAASNHPTRPTSSRIRRRFFNGWGLTHVGTLTLVALIVAACVEISVENPEPELPVDCPTLIGKYVIGAEHVTPDGSEATIRGVSSMTTESSNDTQLVCVGQFLSSDNSTTGQFRAEASITNDRFVISLETTLTPDHN